MCYSDVGVIIQDKFNYLGIITCLQKVKLAFWCKAFNTGIKKAKMDILKAQGL